MRRTRSALVLAASLALAPGLAGAEEVPDSRRQVGGHTFLPTVAAPLAASSFGLRLKFGYGSATGQTYDDQGNPVGGSRTYSVGGLGQDIDFQSAFGESFTLRGRFATSLFSGTDGKSAVVVGTTIQAGGSLGAEWSTPVGRQVRLGVSLDVDRAPQLNLLMAAAIAQAIRNGSLDSAAAFQEDKVTTWRPTFSAAWSPSPAWGLVGKAGYTYASLGTETYGTLKREAVVLSAAADLDGQKLWRIPLGFSLSLVDSIPIKGAETGLTDVALGVLYTGKTDVVMGAVLGWQALHIRPQYPDPLKSSTGYLDVLLRVYWP